MCGDGRAANLASGFFTGLLSDGSGEELPIVTSIGKVKEALLNLAEAVENFAGDVWDVWLKPILEFSIEEGLPWLLDRLADAIDFVSGLIERHGPIILGILVGIGTFIAGLKIYDAVKRLIGVFQALWAVIAANPILAIIAVIAALVTWFITAYKTNDEFRARVDAAWAKIKDTFKTVMDFIKGAFTKDWTEVFGNVLGEQLNAFFQNVSNVVDGVKAIFKGIIDFIVGTFTLDWKRAWQGVKDIFGGIFSTLDSLLKAPLNGVIGLINGAIGGINKLIRSANDGIGETFGFNIKEIGKIPYLAKGGVLKRGQVGLLEGSGAEAVVPLEKNNEWIGKMADAFIARLQNGEHRLSGNASVLSALDSISERVSYQTPAIAQGNILPYSVVNSGGSLYTSGDNTAILDALRELYGLLEGIQEAMETIQFVAQFGDIRALARSITKEQRRDAIAGGR